MVNRIWPTAVAGKVDSVSSVSASACHIGGPNSVNPGQIMLVYGNCKGLSQSVPCLKMGHMLWKIFAHMTEMTLQYNL